MYWFTAKNGGQQAFGSAQLRRWKQVIRLAVTSVRGEVIFGKYYKVLFTSYNRQLVSEREYPWVASRSTC